MNLSRNKLNKIINTKYQSRKNRPLKKKKAGASKIHTKFTKKRKNGGKGKNLRKNSLKKKIKFHKKGGASEDELIKQLEKAKQNLTEADEITKEAAEAEVTRLTNELDNNPENTGAEELTNPPEAAAAAEAAKRLEEEEEEEKIKMLEEKAAAVAEAAAEAAAEAVKAAKLEAEKAAEAVEPAKSTLDNSDKDSSDFTVTLKLGIDRSRKMYVKSIDSSIVGGVPFDGNTAIASLASGETITTDDLKNDPIHDMLTQILNRLPQAQ